MHLETHRCAEKPKRFSIRRYSEMSIIPRGWVLAKRGYDTEALVDYLGTVTIGEAECIKFCPWCGERLPE